MKKHSAERWVELPDGRVVRVIAVRGGYTITTAGTYAPFQLKNVKKPEANNA